MIECIHLNLSYDQLVVIKDLNLKINKKDYLCIIGENGTGKSTLMKAILGLKKPASGQIVTTIKKEIGYLPQLSSSQKEFPASVFEIVLSGLLNKKQFGFYYNKLDQEKAIENLKKLNILDLKNRTFKELSLGQQQRVLLARALCASESLLILDEPTASLDPVATKEFYTLLEALNKLGTTILLVSHDIDEVLPYVTHILELSKDHYHYFAKEDYLKKDGHHS